MTTTCVCTHDEQAHEHYRNGTDCSKRGCGCMQYRSDGAWFRLTTYLKLQAYLLRRRWS